MARCCKVRSGGEYLATSPFSADIFLHFSFVDGFFILKDHHLSQKGFRIVENSMRKRLFEGILQNG